MSISTVSMYQLLSAHRHLQVEMNHEILKPSDNFDDENHEDFKEAAIYEDISERGHNSVF